MDSPCDCIDYDHDGDTAGVGPTDAYNAATAEMFNDIVLTDTVDDFETLGVPVENY